MMRSSCSIEEQFAGVSLGWDFCAEHEWGIKGIRQVFAMVGDPQQFGITRRMVRAVPDHLRLHDIKKPKGCLLVLTSPGFTLPANGQGYPFDELSLWKDQSLAAGWDEESFGIFTTVEHRTHLKSLFEAFQRKDVAIYRGKSGPFANGGLKLVIASKLPQEILDDMCRVDEDGYNLLAAAKATGIEEYLKSKGKRWFTLSPRWANEGKTEVRFWLNPYDQQIYNCGWYSVEDLRLWGDDQGPVLKQAGSRR